MGQSGGPVDKPGRAELLRCFRGWGLSERLELVAELVGSLHPLELRQAGRLLEEAGRAAGLDGEVGPPVNDPASHLPAFADLRCPAARAALLAAIPFLSPSSPRAALSLFNLLQLTQKIPLDDLVESSCLPELLAILSVARHHPAFRIDHRLALSDLWVHFHALHNHTARPSTSCPSSPRAQVSSSPLPDQCNHNQVPTQPSHSPPDRRDADRTPEAVSPAPPPLQSSSTTTSLLSFPTSSTSGPPPAYFQKLRATERRQADDSRLIELQTLWSTGEKSTALKRPEEIYDFHRRLLDLFPHAAGWGSEEARIIPYFLPPGDGEPNPLAVLHYVRELDETADLRIRSSPASHSFLCLPGGVEGGDGGDGPGLPVPLRQAIQRSNFPHLLEHSQRLAAFPLGQLLRMSPDELARQVDLGLKEVEELGLVLAQLKLRNGFSGSRDSGRATGTGPGEELFVDTERSSSASDSDAALQMSLARAPPQGHASVTLVPQSGPSAKGPSPLPSGPSPGRAAVAGAQTTHRWVPAGARWAAGGPALLGGCPGPGAQPAPPLLSCANCGQAGHSGQTCAQPSFADISGPGLFSVSFAPSLLLSHQPSPSFTPQPTPNPTPSLTPNTSFPPLPPHT